VVGGGVYLHWFIGVDDIDDRDEKEGEPEGMSTSIAELKLALSDIHMVLSSSPLTLLGVRGLDILIGSLAVLEDG